MNRTRLVTHSFAAISRYKLRSAFIILGTLIGTAALTLVLAAGAGAKRKMISTVRQLFGASSILVMSGGTQFMGGPTANAARLTLDDIEAVAAEVPQIDDWDPQQAMPNASVRANGRTATARVFGASERFSHVWQRAVARGEAFDAAAVRGSARVALIGVTTARELFGDQDPVGGEILVGNVPLRIIGVLEPFGTDLHGMDRDAEIVIPISTMMRRVMNVDTISAAKLLVRDPSQVDDARRAMKRVLRARHAIPNGRRDDFNVLTSLAVQTMLGKMQRVVNIYLPLAAGVILLVAAIVAASLMLASVNARVGEIGLRRAVGARVEDIQLQFIVETAATMFLGGILGVAIGNVLAELVAQRFRLEGVFSASTILIALAVTAVTGIVAGVLPARRAARLDPADALR
jgi:putative ABC transport system permease protein